MLRVISEEITAYRRQIDERKNDLPLWERKVLTCDEAAAYSGIGIRRLRKMALAKGCPFAIANGTQILIASVAAILISIPRKRRLANAKSRCWISSKKHSLWKKKDRSFLIFIVKLL